MLDGLLPCAAVFPHQSSHVRLKHRKGCKPMKNKSHYITVPWTLTTWEGKASEDMRFLLLWFPSHLLFPLNKRPNFNCLSKTSKENQGLICKDLDGCQQANININIIGTANCVTAASSTFSLKLTGMKSTDCLTNHCWTSDPAQDPALALCI